MLHLPPKDLTKLMLRTFRKVGKQFFIENAVVVSAALVVVNAKKPVDVRRIAAALVHSAAMVLLLNLKNPAYFLAFSFLAAVGEAWLHRTDMGGRRVFTVAACVLFAEIVFTGALIQIPTVPRRATLQYTFLNTTVLLFTLEYAFVRLGDRARTVAAGAVIVLCIGYAVFAAAECVSMAHKWNAMLQDARAQKAAGVEDIVVDKNTFVPQWRNYGDFEILRTDADFWTNRDFARFLGVRSVTAQ